MKQLGAVCMGACVDLAQGDLVILLDRPPGRHPDCAVRYFRASKF
jgi:hypothetical protein